MLAIINVNVTLLFLLCKKVRLIKLLLFKAILFHSENPVQNQCRIFSNMVYYSCEYRKKLT